VELLRSSDDGVIKSIDKYTIWVISPEVNSRNLTIHKSAEPLFWTRRRK